MTETENQTLFNTLYIRNLLEERRLTITNIQKARRIVIETDKEIIEAICLPAVAYDKDSVQTDGATDTAINILDRLHIERSKQRYDSKKMLAELDAKQEEVYWLDYHAFKLPNKTRIQDVIVARFYDGMTNAETEKKLHLGEDCAKGLVKKGIAMLAEQYSSRAEWDAMRAKKMEEEEQEWHNRYMVAKKAADAQKITPLSPPVPT